MAELKIMGILVDNRADISPAVQDVLSDYGEQILMRAGLPSPDRQRGLITLTLEAGDSADELAERLESIEGVKARMLSF